MLKKAVGVVVAVVSLVGIGLFANFKIRDNKKEFDSGNNLDDDLNNEKSNEKEWEEIIKAKIETEIEENFKKMYNKSINWIK